MSMVKIRAVLTSILKEYNFSGEKERWIAPIPEKG
jgi:hypothetical protein